MEKCISTDSIGATILRRSDLLERAEAHGKYVAKCFDKDGNLKWEDTIDNVVTTEAKNLALDTIMAGAGYTVVGPYMGLISSVSFTAVAATDTAAQINGTNGWKEAGSAGNFPLYTAPRKTCVWSPATAGAKALTSALSFAIVTTGGTIKGCFIVFGAGASSTIASTTGVLYSAGALAGGDKIVSASDVVQVSYSTSL